MQRVAIPGTTLAFDERGSGEPLVFVHGGHSDRRMWAAQVDAFSDRYRVLALSRRYARPNDDIPSGAVDRMEVHVRDLAAFLEAARAAPAHVVGNSWGGSIALRLALDRPDLFRSLTLQEPPVIPLLVGQPPSPLRLLASLAREPRATASVLRFARTGYLPAKRLYLAGRLEEAMATFASGVMGREWFLRLPAARLQQMRENGATAIAQARIDGGFVPVTRKELRGLRVPTLLVEGDSTPRFLLELSRIMGEDIPGARRVTVPHASHIANEQNPEGFNAAVRAFLDSLGSASPPARRGAPLAAAVR